MNQPISLEVAVMDFILTGEADGLSPATLKWRKSQLNKLLKAFPYRKLEAISTRQIREYIVSLRSTKTKFVDAPQRPEVQAALSPESVNTHIRCLHTFFKWASIEYHMPNPMQNIRYPQPQTRQPKAIDPLDFVRLLAATDEGIAGVRDRAILAFLADSGCSLGGLLSLTVPNLNMELRHALITEKGNVSRIVYFTPYTQKLLKHWLILRDSPTEAIFISLTTQQPLTASGVSAIIKRLKAKTGIKGRVNPHAFRHGFAVQYLQAGGDAITLAKLLGHRNVNTTAQFYALFTRDELAEMHNRFSPIKHIIADQD